MIKNIDDLKNICTQLPVKGKYKMHCTIEQYRIIRDFKKPKEDSVFLEINPKYDAEDWCEIKISGFEFFIKHNGYLDSMNFNLKKPMHYYIEKL
jgi:hypothetical protein